MKPLTIAYATVALMTLSGCNYDLLNEANGSGGSHFNNVTAPVTESTPSVAEVVESEAETEVEPTIETIPVAAVVPVTETPVDAEQEPVEEEVVEEDGPCDPCASERTIDLAWVPESEAVGYRIFYGPSNESVDQLLAELTENTPEFDLQAPLVSYHAWYDMGLYNGDDVCFSIESYDSQDNVTVLGAACGTITS